ncbi:hypothetical protein FISHEDRAFT_28725, partial [Fistulina hepatica ATCC 64428]
LALEYLSVVFALFVKPSRFRPLLFIPIAALSYYHLFCTVSDSVRSAYNHGILVAQTLFMASDYILLTDVQRVFSRKDQKGPTYNAPALVRFEWAFDLLTSYRGIGWLHEPRNIPRLDAKAASSRLSFVLLQLRWLAHFWMCYEFACVCIAWSPLFAPGSEIAHRSWLDSYFIVVVLLALQYSLVGFPYHLAAALLVACGLSSPDRWPPAMGSWSEAFTLRGFWGKTWHSMLRRTLTSHARFITFDLLRLPPKTRVSRYTALYASFLVSGIMHELMEYHLILSMADDGLTWKTYTYTCMPYYFWIATAMIVEDAAIELGKRVGIEGGRLWKVVGYLWFWTVW